MIKLKRIFAPTDFSDFSNRAMQYACEFAKRFSAELHVVNIVEDVYPLVPEPGMMLPAAATYLADLKEGAERSGELSAG